MIITDEMIGVIERNAGSLSIEQDENGAVSFKIMFDPDLDVKTEDGKIFINEVKKMALNAQVYDEP